MITKKHDKLYKAANEYANSIAQHDERKTYCVEDFIAGAKWADKTMIDKACEWLLNHNDYQRVLDNGCSIRFDMTQCVMDFRKAMETQQ